MRVNELGLRVLNSGKGDKTCGCLQVKAVRVEGSQLTQQGDVLLIIEPSEE